MSELELPLDEVRFVVVDVESTGGMSGEHRLTEVAMVVVTGGRCTASFSSLVNPHQVLSPFIEKLTGITTQMVADAPEEYEALPALEDELWNPSAVFVAHNVEFDWGLIRKSFARNSMHLPDVQRLCTCKLSRRLNGTQGRHNLDAVTARYSVTIKNRHRALGDAMATAQVLLAMIRQAREEHGAQTLADLLSLQYAQRVPGKTASLTKLKLHEYLVNLPDEPGVYRFFSKRNRLLYVGKAKSLQKRVATYFYNTPLHGHSVSKMIRYIHHLTWTETGSELGALLLENREIKELRPAYNVAGRDYAAPYFIAISNEDFPRIDIASAIDGAGCEYYGPFKSRLVADRILNVLKRMYRLRSCDGPLVPNADFRPCFDYHIGRCPAPCAELESRSPYMERVEAARLSICAGRSGLLEVLHEKMYAASHDLDFETAAFYRDSIQELEKLNVGDDGKPRSVNALDSVVVVARGPADPLMEVFALYGGRLRLQEVVPVHGPHDTLHAHLRSIYMQSRPDDAFTLAELDELKIITGWMYRKRSNSVRFTYNPEKPSELSEQIRTLSALLQMQSNGAA
ncbi:MAG: UvrB/UvrC motif-containing protein [Ignavibacteria bacterium]|nr:UvrB/UvrC motif-containing protein [Ignavibacteria bacterium]